METPEQSQGFRDVIYLDLCAASEAAMPEIGSPWRKIRELLMQGVKGGDFICPLPYETIVEAAACSLALRIEIDELFQDISKGVRFRSLSEIMLDKTLALIRPSHPAPFVQPLEFPQWGYREEAAKAMAKMHAAAKARMTANMANQFYTPEMLKMKQPEIMRSSGGERSGMLWRDLTAFIARGGTPGESYEASGIMEGLIGSGLTVAEAEALKVAVRNMEWVAIPESTFEILLGSLWDYDTMKGHRPNYKPNDEIDRWRAAVALAHAELLITDKYMASLCQRALATFKFDITILAVNQTDKIIEWLSARVADGSSRPQLRA